MDDNEECIQSTSHPCGLLLRTCGATHMTFMRNDLPTLLTGGSES